MASSSIELAAKLLGKLLVQEVLYLAEVSGKVQELQSELEWMQCFLYDADEKQNRNALLRKWVFDIKESALKAEDLIETYILRIVHKRQNHVLCGWDDLLWLSCCWRNAKSLHFIGADIDALSAKISKMSSRLQAYGIKSSYGLYSSSLAAMDNKTLLIEDRRTYPHVVDKDVIGLNKAVKELVGKLKRKGHPTIVVVHGMGGIGKTTLARQLFNHSYLKDHFDGCAWVYVSQQPQQEAICRDIADQLIPEANKEERDFIKGLNCTRLHQRLCEMLNEKKYLVILDDIWNRRVWDHLKSALTITHSSPGSKLFITTRDPQVISGPDLADHVAFYYQVEVLDRALSWELLKKTANINNIIDADKKMVDLGNKMLDHCNGHPLAISLLGGILAKKKSVEEWVLISNDLSFHLQGDESYSSVYEVLAMSYYELPYHMKPCFLHLGNFPNGFEVPVEKLYHLWIAEGTVSLTQDKVVTGNPSLEEISEYYMNELVQKNMLQVGSRDSYGKIRTCRIHDLMRDKCIKMNIEEDFLQIIDNRACESEHQQANFQNATSENLRRMTVYVDQQVTFPLPRSVSGKVPPLRSLLFFPTKDGNDEQELQDCKRIVASICKDFKLLRVLDFEGVHLRGSLPRRAGNLIYLRYLSLKGTRITQLPDSIGNLRSLMILDLRVSFVIIKLPNLLWKMKNLRHLYFPSRVLSKESHARKQGYEIAKSNEMLKLDQLSHLEKLEDVDLDKVDVMGLLGLRSMRKLTASCVYKKESLKPFLKSTSIKDFSLKICADIINDHELLSAVSGCGFLKVLHIDAKDQNETVLPMNVVKALPKNLVELGFWYCILLEDPMPILENFPKLRKLELHMFYYGKSLICSEKGFPELTYLVIDGLFRLTSWFVEEGGLPKLKKVEIYNSRLRMLPNVLPSNVDIACRPCVKGIEKYGTCPFVNKRDKKVHASTSYPCTSISLFD